MTSKIRSTRRISVVAGALGLASIALCAVTFSMAYETPFGVEPAKITDWMQGWGSIAAVIAGLVAALITAGLLLHEMGEARRARQEAEAARAEALSDRQALSQEREEQRTAPARFMTVGYIQVTIIEQIEGVPVPQDEHVLLSYFQVYVHNLGSVPVTDLVVEVKCADDELPILRQTRGIRIPDREQRPTKWPSGRETLPNLSFGEHFQPPRETSPSVLEPGGAVVTLMFTDINGRRWQRSNNGEPEPVAPSQQPMQLNVDRVNRHPMIGVGGREVHTVSEIHPPTAADSAQSTEDGEAPRPG